MRVWLPLGVLHCLLTTLVLVLLQIFLKSNGCTSCYFRFCLPFQLDQPLKERISCLRNRFFPLRVTPFFKGFFVKESHKNCSSFTKMVGKHGSVFIHLKFAFLISFCFQEIKVGSSEILNMSVDLDDNLPPAANLSSSPPQSEQKQRDISTPPNSPNVSASGVFQRYC